MACQGFLGRVTGQDRGIGADDYLWKLWPMNFSPSTIPVRQ
jgi:hypothetical protein